MLFRDRLVALEKLTHESTRAPVEAEPLPNGLHLRNLSVLFIPVGYSLRSELPMSMPVFRVDLR